MNKLLLTALCAVGLSVPAFAQTTNVTATNLKMGGTPIATGTITITPVSRTNDPISFTDGTGALNDPTGFTATIVNGVINPSYTVPDQALSTATVAGNPLYYSISISNTYTKKTFSFLVPPGTITGSTFALDHYAPPQVAAVAPTGIIVQPTVPASCSVPSLFYPTVAINGAYKIGRCVGGVFIFDSTSSGPGGGTFNYRGVYANANSYAVGDVVTLNGSSYTALLAQAANANQTPGLATMYWGLLAAAGSNGAAGSTPTIVIGSVTQGTASATLTAAGNNTYQLNLSLPQGAAGTNGSTPSFSIGTVSTGAAGSQASVTIDPSSTATSVKLNFSIPQGVAGTSGTGSSIALKVNGTANGSQTVLNLIPGTNVSLSDNGSGGITVAVTGLATVATSGNYNDLTNKPVLSTGIDITAAPYFASPYGATTTTTSASVASGATSVPVTSASTFVVGNGVLVTGGGATGWTGSDFIGTVTAVSGNTLTVTPALSASVASGVVVQHDESAAFNALTAACKTKDCNVSLPPIPGTLGGEYLINGPFLDTANSNAMVVLPNEPLVGAQGQEFSMSGPVRPVALYNGVNIATNYQGSSSGQLFGVRVNGAAYGGMSNTYVTLSNLRFNAGTTAAAPNFTIFDCSFCKAYVQRESVWMNGNYGVAYGVKYPVISNDVDNGSEKLTSIGATYGARLGEHTYAKQLHGCGFMFDSVSTYSGVVGHANAVTVGNIWGQVCPSMIYGGSTPQTINIQSVDAEVATKICVDPNNMLSGDVNYNVPYNDGRTSQTITGPPNLTGCAGVRFHNMNTGACYGPNCPTTAVNTSTLASGMTHRWKMQDGGTTMADSINSTTNLTATNVTYVSNSGYTGNVASFNGSSSYARVSSTTAAQVTGAAPFAVSFWHTPSTVGGDKYAMGTLDFSSGLNGWMVEDGYATGNITVYLAIDGSHLISVAFSPGITANTRYNVVANYDGSKTAAGVSLFVNGVQITSKTVTNDSFGSGTIASPTGYFTMGGSGGATPGDLYGGLLADAIMWNRQLTTSEVSSLYAVGPGGF